MGLYWIVSVCLFLDFRVYPDQGTYIYRIRCSTHSNEVSSKTFIIRWKIHIRWLGSQCWNGSCHVCDLLVNWNWQRVGDSHHLWTRCFGKDSAITYGHGELVWSQSSLMDTVSWCEVSHHLWTRWVGVYTVITYGHGELTWRQSSLMDTEGWYGDSHHLWTQWVDMESVITYGHG